MIFYSSFENIYLILPIIGFVIGLFGTMLGGGGGFFFLPVLTLLLGVPAHTAVATSLAATLPIGLVGSWGHHKKGNIDVKTGSLFCVAGIVGALLGARLTNFISGSQLKLLFGIYSILIAINMLANGARKNQQKLGKSDKAENKLIRITKGSFFGLSAGAIAGTFGTSGTAPVIAGLFSMRLPVKLVVGTSLLVVLVNTVFAFGAHFLVGTIDITLIAFLTAGSVIGAFLGPRLFAKAKIGKSEKKVQYIYAAVVATIGILMIVNR
ncbi:sulfite exporter TauE/SafE family protein [Draconibacterium sp. IB214405]|uniref:sulfite exporter TauE/SafE family protein n=1 Tax=Draconibacterium sp. IB214405 TaxID=3097352 RepID=UPI002A11B163|nr:sulfite exporter TauE/SafE family protein [Draconibacterium sp. IB214405]MDX8339960.1 sulfite exporter TauE/SafE family protein [Draconibacterium sp. IB214405]